MIADQDSERTTFRDVMVEILRRITQGPWGPGSLLPGEIELAEEFGCSRTTMNRALREVTELGYLDRKRKAGTRVRLAPIRQARFEMPLVRAEIEKTGAAYSYQLLHREVLLALDVPKQRFGLLADAQVLHIICLHHAAGEPFQLEDRWINLQALPEALDQDFTLVGPNEWLVATVPYSEVEVSFHAMAAEGLVASRLGHLQGGPVFCVERATWWQNAAITFVTLSYQSGYRMTARY